MTTDHPVAPTREQITSWATRSDFFSNIARDIYAAGADAELKAVRDWLFSEGLPKLSRNIYAARRPRALSLKEQAQRIMAENGTTIDGRLELDVDDRQIIEAALLLLPD
jgi:hypothetical protein